jgi:hypothetical protein
MSTLRVSTIQDTAGSNSSTPAAIANGIAKAWVNFNGTGTVAIRAQYNVSSITDNGVGLYAINFTNALADTNYAISATASPVYNGAVINTGNNSTGDDNYSVSTTSCNVCVRGNGSSFNIFDPLAAHIAIFR